MKRVLLVVLMLFSILVISSCGKKKVITDRNMSNFLEDFSFSDDEDGLRFYNSFNSYIKGEKSVVNEFRNINGFQSLKFRANKRIVIKKMSYTIYNISENEAIPFRKDGNSNYTETVDDDLKKAYILATDYNEGDVVYIEPLTELSCSYEYIDLEIKKGMEVQILFGAFFNKVEPLRLVKNNGGMYNLVIEYSAYI